jgi:hypothetical protein
VDQKRHGNWRGGRTTSGNGYVYVEAFDHPRADSRGRMYEHIIMIEAAIGRLLPQKACVHHVNEIKNDNRNDNLVVCENQAYHLLLHARTRAYYATGNAHSIKCAYCRKWMLPDNPERRSFSKVGLGWHYSCRSNYDKIRWKERKKVKWLKLKK